MDRASLYTLSYTSMDRHLPIPQPADAPHAAPPAGAPPAPLPAGLHLRHLGTQKEFDACVALQHETWAADFSERVPAASLKVGHGLGGVTAGAFDAQERLLGLVFCIPGIGTHRLGHLSDMLPGRPPLPDPGIRP